jgi:rhodanese-related sulfurtransferase/ferredoxin
VPASLPTAFLAHHDSAAWSRALETLAPSMHEVDRAAARIWFRFFPLALADVLTTTDDLARARRHLRLDGDAHLANQVDTSHWFLYGHRFWPDVKAAVAPLRDTLAQAGADDPGVAVQRLARVVADARGLDVSLLVGIAAVGLMTLRQVGLEAFVAAAPATGSAPSPLDTRGPQQIVRARQAATSRGLVARMLGGPARHDARFDERRADGVFPVLGAQHLTTAASTDARPYRHSRGYSQDGPIPAQCRTGSCGTCWIGILGGADRLSDVDDIESRRLLECGYLDAVEGKPFIRLACMAKASGNVTFVIPPWNGFLTKGLLRLAGPGAEGTPPSTPAPASTPASVPARAQSSAPAIAAAPPPARVQSLSAPDLKAMMDAGQPFELIDVRTAVEWETARIAGARLLDRPYHDHLMTLPPDTALVFQCHHGIRSRAAAEYFREKGFERLYNLEGGIDAWSALVDPSVPRY